MWLVTESQMTPATTGIYKRFQNKKNRFGYSKFKYTAAFFQLEETAFPCVCFHFSKHLQWNTQEGLEQTANERRPGHFGTRRPHPAGSLSQREVNRKVKRE